MLNYPEEPSQPWALHPITTWRGRRLWAFLYLSFIYAWTSSTAHQIARLLICPISDCKNTTRFLRRPRTNKSHRHIPQTLHVSSSFPLEKHPSSQGLQLMLLAYKRLSAISYTEGLQRGSWLYFLGTHLHQAHELYKIVWSTKIWL